MTELGEIKLNINVRHNIKEYLMSKVVESCRKNKNFEFEANLFILVLDSSHKQAPQLRNNKPSALLAEPSETYSMKSKNRRAINQMHYSQTKTTTH